MPPIGVEGLETLVGRWGYLVIFVGMVLENAGLPLPGETLTLLGGYAAGSGQLNGVAVVASAASGAVIGDNLGYWAGRRFGWGLLLRLARLLGQGPEAVDALKRHFLQRAAVSVILGRFVAVLRVLAGPLAGASGMPYRQFVLCNLAGALLWSSTMVSLAWLCGRWIPFQRMVNGVAEIGLVALALVMLVLVVPRLLARLEARLSSVKQIPKKDLTS